jgi:hypothetical protein
MKEIKLKNIIFTDDENQRMVMGDTFNFALDKESGISACWGETINDSPEYDPISPQELIFKIDEIFDLNKFLSNFNFLANIKIKKNKTEFENITDVLAATALPNLTCLSTLASVVLIFDNNLNELKIDDVLTVTKYIRNFKIPVIIQINTDTELSYAEIIKLKLLGTSIQIKTTDNFNAKDYLKNLKSLKENDIKVSSKVNINKNSYDEVIKIIDKLDKDTSMKIYFTLPYITTKKYVEIQKKFIDAKLDNVRIATCAHNKFNKRAANIYLTPMDCDASRFSVYIENDTIYPCEYAKVDGIKISDCKSIHDFWFGKSVSKIRNYIVENNFCKFVGK